MIRVVFNRKGGVGKSSIACNLAAVAASQGKSTLIFDLDSQANTTSYLGHNGQDGIAGVPEFFESTISLSYRDFKPQDFVRSTAFPDLSLVSANATLADMEQKLASRHKIYKLRDFLNKLSEEYEEIFIDTPPALNFYSLSALIAAKRCLIPFDCDAFARDALMELIHSLNEIKEDHNEDLTIEGIIINQFDARANLPQAAVAELAAANLPVLEPYLNYTVKMKESHAASKPLIFLMPKHKLSQQFIALYHRLNGVETFKTDKEEVEALT